MVICFFARLNDRRLFEVVEFYKIDIQALRSLGHEVILVNSIRSLIFVKCDAYFVWWFGYGVFAALLARIRRVPMILTGAVHTTNCGSLNDWVFHKRVLMMLAMKLASRTLFISKVDFGKLGSFKPASPSVVYCAVDPAKYYPEENVDKCNLILTITHLTKDNVARKMLMESIEAFALFVKEYPDYVFEICGSFGDALEDVRNKIHAYGLGECVLLKGRVSDEQKIQLLRASRVYLQPSTCEGFGLAILEAKACGVPVVTSREPCIVEINGNSVVYGDSVAELADGLRHLVSDSEYYYEMSRLGLENVKMYSFEARRNALRDVIEAVSA